MKEYEIKVEVSGYCRGVKVFRIKANSEEEAKEIYYDGKVISDEIHRDDREQDILDITIVEEKNDK